MKRNTLITTAIVGALSLGLLATAPVLARGPGRGAPGTMMFERFDTNGDGTITLEEYQAGREQRFKQMDLNGDGAVTQDEVRQAMQQMRAQYRGQGGNGMGRGSGPCGGGPGQPQPQPQQ